MTRHVFANIVAGAFALAATAGTAAAQAPPQAPLQVPNPTYTSIPMEIDVNRPAAEVWKRIGKFCDIGEWFQIPCTIISGKDGEFGAVRSVANEILVAKTELSYVYTQPVREGRPYNMYHGILEARPLPDQAARDADIARRRTQFMRALQNMKTLAEGGTLPPPPARGGR